MHTHWSQFVPNMSTRHPRTLSSTSSSQAKDRLLRRDRGVGGGGRGKGGPVTVGSDISVSATLADSAPAHYQNDDEVLLYVHRNHRLIREGSPGTATSTFTQLLSSATAKTVDPHLSDAAVSTFVTA